MYKKCMSPLCTNKTSLKYQLDELHYTKLEYRQKMEKIMKMEKNPRKIQEIRNSYFERIVNKL
ncbi:hypothetical protein [Phthorimaea operculella granulovirus]|uniref:Uncharacterized protein n=1 Tax=Phthorimaea operculella granulovirus TaxID=192584 RepID=Q8JS42_9BBAC|nr:hypothetical protein [Phthorimaea operculella granulovirus]AAM70215.1 hypothetical protein [Phthorimaea operculella granulovirus]QBH65982.1 hypothetical protein PhopGVgp017 [Phthorimaea operculella granulovirus]